MHLSRHIRFGRVPILPPFTVDDAIDVEVRQRIKNLQEGTSAWEVEYGRVMDQIKRKHGIDN